MKNITKAVCLCCLLMVFLPALLNAHAPNQSYIYMRVYDTEVGGRFEITIKDLNQAVGLELKEDLSLEDLAPHLDKINAYLKSKINFSSKYGEHSIVFKDVELVTRGYLGTFALMDFSLENTSQVPDLLEIDYQAIFDQVENNKGVLVIEYNFKAGIIANEAGISLIFDEGNTKQSLKLDSYSVFTGFWAMIQMGMHHIWIGLDHILFLLALILPSVLLLMQMSEAANSPRDNGQFSALLTNHQWRPVPLFKPALWFIIKIITFFTIAHSITLSLAALEILILPSRLVESIIALSIALAAIHNMGPILQGRDWLIAFLFGLFHGFGFASVLAESGLSGDYLVLSLLGFNIGVEIGQLVIICIIFPVLYLLRKTILYRFILNYGSIILIIISLYWFIERALDIDIPVKWLIGL